MRWIQLNSCFELQLYTKVADPESFHFGQPDPETDPGRTKSAKIMENFTLLESISNNDADPFHFVKKRVLVRLRILRKYQNDLFYYLWLFGCHLSSKKIHMFFVILVDYLCDLFMILADYSLLRSESGSATLISNRCKYFGAGVRVCHRDEAVAFCHTRLLVSYNLNRWSITLGSKVTFIFPRPIVRAGVYIIHFAPPPSGFKREEGEKTGEKGKYFHWKIYH